MPAPERSRHRRSLIILLVVLTACVLAVDQITKQLAVTSLELGTYHPVLGSVLGISLVLNPGAAFSLAEGSTWLFTVAAVVVTVVILRFARRLGSRGWALALGALLGGTLGNLADRLFREPGFGVGHVVDFINYNGWFVGNVADVAIVLSAVGIVVLSFRGVGIDGTRARASESDSDSAETDPGDSDAAGSDAAGADAAGTPPADTPEQN